MPLIKSKSKKAFESNMEAEMKAGKPKDQSLAIAYSMKRKASKKMADGGMISQSEREAQAKRMDDEQQSKQEANDSIDEQMDSIEAAKKHKFAYGGMAQNDRNPGTPARKSDDKRFPESEYMSKNWSEGNPPPRKPDDHRLPEDEYMADHFAYGGMAEDDNEPPMPGRKPNDKRLPMDEYMADHFANGGEVNGNLKEYYPSADERPQSITDAIMRRRKMADGGMVDLEENSREKPNFYDELNEDAANKEQYDDSQISPQPEDSNEHGDDIESDIHDMVSKIRSKLRLKRQM